MKRLCTYCGASSGRNPEYLAAAESLGKSLALRGIGLVFGGNPYFARLFDDLFANMMGAFFQRLDGPRALRLLVCFV